VCESGPFAVGRISYQISPLSLDPQAVQPKPAYVASRRSSGWRPPVHLVDACAALLIADDRTASVEVGDLDPGLVEMLWIARSRSLVVPGIELGLVLELVLKPPAGTKARARSGDFVLLA
jgi:hypothetical protein